MDSVGRIGLIVPHLINNLDVELVEVVHKTVSRYGYDTVLISGIINFMNEMLDEDYSKGLSNIYDLIISSDFDGFIFSADLFCSDRLRSRILDMLRKTEKPCVVIGYQQNDFPVITIPESELLYLSAMHLIHKHDCRRLYCIGGYKGDEKSEERISGFRRAMDEAGLPYEESSIFYGEYWSFIPHDIAVRIAEGDIPLPDGVVCASDIMAVEFSRTLRSHGIRVPDDIKITGCDGDLISLTEYVSITTVAGASKCCGKNSAERLLRLMGNDVTETREHGFSLVIGESCGCTDKSSAEQSIALSEIRDYAGTYYRIKQSYRLGSCADILSKMSECNTPEDVMRTAGECIFMIPGFTRAEICLCEDWQRDLQNPALYRRGGLSSNMLLGFEIGNSDFDTPFIEFPSSELLPYFKQPHDPQLTVATSLHCKGQIFGYICFSYKNAAEIILDDYLMNWCDSVSGGLNIVQNKMYKTYVNQRIEAISEYAPILGIYNKRGLIERLTQIMINESETARTLTILSYIQNKKKKYPVPPLHAIVNALRIAATEEMLLASIEDDMIAIVSCESGPKGLHRDWAVEIAEKTYEIYKGSVVIEPENIVFLSEKISLDDILSISRILDTAVSDIKGKMLTMQAGVFSYRDTFTSLRENIFSSPHNEWSVGSITRSLGISKSHFQRIYKELFGTSCKEDIIAARMQTAEYYLIHTELSVTEIAERSGYPNTSHFIRQFKKKNGVSPNEYRKTKR
ncbi:MAG: substrate-binding domain-containing protein [Ruminococcus sp.]|nr:substrate-binding domain-containing protein [Ruminococcus sp.]